MEIPFFFQSNYPKKYVNDLSKLIKKTIISGNFILGNEVEQFENNFAKYIGSNYCVAVGNGLNALELALKSLEFEPNSEIIVPANTFYATVLAIVNCGLIPIFIEPLLETYNIDPEKIKKAINKNTKAILVVHLYGLIADMKSIIEISNQYNLKIIEDVAQAAGSEKNEIKAGNFGDISAFSFYPTKNLGAFGDAGAIITNNKNLQTKIKMFRNYGFKEKNIVGSIGTNSRMDEIQATILNYKLNKLDFENEIRRKIAKRYLTKLENKHITLPTNEIGKSHIWHLFTIRTKLRKELINYLNLAKIETIIHYPLPPYKQITFKEYINCKFPISDKIHNEILSIPLHPFLTINEVNYIISTINKFKL